MYTLQAIPYSRQTFGYSHFVFEVLLYTNIDLKLRNKSQGPMHYKIAVYTMDTCSIPCCTIMTV